MSGSLVRSARIRIREENSSRMESDNGGGSSSGGGGNSNGSGGHSSSQQPEIKRRRLLNGSSRTGPRTRGGNGNNGKLENEAIITLEEMQQGLLQKDITSAMVEPSCDDNNPDENNRTSVHGDNNDDDSSSSSSSSDSSDSSDTDDSSEMDEETTEKKKVECLADMSDLEKQYLFLRELLYRERITHAHHTIHDVRAGKAREYLGPLEELQENMRIRIEVASVQRDLRVKSLNIKYDAEKLAIKQNLESERQLIYSAIRSDLEDKIHRLELDRNNDFTTDYWFEATLKKKNKKTIDIFGEKKKKAVTVNGPYIVYMLSDVDIVEDWTVLKKALSAPKRKNGESVLAY